MLVMLICAEIFDVLVTSVQGKKSNAFLSVVILLHSLQYYGLRCICILALWLNNTEESENFSCQELPS